MSGGVEPIIQRFMGGVPHLGALGIRYVGHGIDWAELALPPSPRLASHPDAGGDGGGIVANGAIFSLIDSAGGFAVSVRRGIIGHATLDLRVDYLAAPPPGSTVTARMTCYRVAREVAFVRGEAHAGDPARPVAAATGTFMFLAARP